MREITLTRGMVALVDDEDYERVMAMGKWWVSASKYAACCVIGEGGRSTYLHHAVLGRGTRTDHVDGDGFNNQKSNLRTCTQSQNMANRKKNRGGSSRFKGVCWLEARNRWKAQIMKDYKRISIGYFEYEEDAARAYDKKARELFGEFALINFPEGE